MNYDGRPYRGLRADDLLVAELLGSQPSCPRHVVDQPWRLAGPDTQSGRFARLWQDPAGRAAGFAAWQTPWAALDACVRDGPESPAILDSIFTWAGRLFRELDAERGTALPYWLECRSDDEATAKLAAERGFTMTEERYLCLEQPLGRVAGSSAPAVPPPGGFFLRELAGTAEAHACAELHRTAFGSQSMTGRWRARSLQMPQYRAELDLVAVAADGRLAGFVVGWLDPARGIGQVEPLGVRPEFTRLGIAAALISELLARFARLGAQHALVEVEPGNVAAIRAYEAAGFRQRHTVRAFGKLYG